MAKKKILRKKSKSSSKSVKSQKKVVKRRPSKIVVPLDNEGSKDKSKAFRCSQELFDLLNQVENASEFIQNACLEAFSKETWVTCPTCKGKGQITQNKRLKGKKK